MEVNIRGLAVGGSIKWIQSISYNFLEASRFRMLDVDNGHHTFKYWITAAPGTASLLGALSRGWLYLKYTQVDAQAMYQSCGFVQSNDSANSGFGLLPKLFSWTLLSEENGGWGSYLYWVLGQSWEYYTLVTMYNRILHHSNTWLEISNMHIDLSSEGLEK